MAITLPPTIREFQHERRDRRDRSSTETLVKLVDRAVSAPVAPTT
jgi:hypothetical protein